jgi:hypothetical protein
MTINNNFTNIEEEIEDDVIILTDYEISKLLELKYKELINNSILNIKNVSTKCSISLEDFKLEDSILIMPSCDHIFLKEPIIKWLTKYNNRCPVCNTEIDRGIPINFLKN